MNKYLVETVSLFRMRYVVEASHADYAVDAAVNSELKEFSQVHAGETVLSVREITTEDYLTIFDEDNKYLIEWTDEQKIDFINR